jgi:PAS domain S-box-containing protein
MNVVLNESNTAMLLENSKRQIEFVNKAFCDLFNIDAEPDNLIGMDCSQAAEYNKVLFIDEKGFVDGITELLKNRIKVVDEVLFMKNETVLQRDYIPIFKQEEYIGHMWSYKIITDTYLLNKKIEQQKQFYEDVLNSLPVDVAVFNPEHKYLFVNKMAIPKEDVRKWIIGKDDFEYVKERNRPIKDAEYRRKLFNQVVNNSDSEEVEYQESFILSNGFSQYILRKMKPVFNEDGSLKVVVGCGVDITKRVQNEKLLQESEQKYKELVNNLQDIIFNVDKFGNFTFLNPAWEKITGYKSDEYIGKNYIEYFAKQLPSSTDTFESLINKSGKLSHKEYLVNTRFGEKVLNVYLEEIKVNSEVVGYRGTASDITDRKKVEEQMKLAMQREKELNDLKSKFVGMVSHEFRTPLATISSSVELVKLISEKFDKDLFDKIFKHTNKVNEQIKRMTELMNEVLLISKIESGGVSATFEKIDLMSIIRDVKTEHAYTDFQININSKSKKIILNIDQNMIHHILTNLISNAIKYSSDLKIVDINIIAQDDFVSIEVRDYGIGIPEKDQAKLFTSFFRASNISNLPGTGLGLVVVKYFLDLHGGTIDVKSTQNKGSSFLKSHLIYK